jgi:type IV pilus biogenesis protein CpaD/CtpE
MKNSSNTHFARATTLMALVACFALSACVADDTDLGVNAPAYGGSERHPIRVSANHKAYVKDCHDWSREASETQDNQFLDSHGCAVQTNIAKMIADPHVINSKPKTPEWQANTVTSVNARRGGFSDFFSSLFGI